MHEPTAASSQHPSKAIRILFSGVLGMHAALVVAQPFLAGMFLSGLVDAIQVHGIIGSTLPALGLLQIIAAVLLWRPGRGPLWPLQISSVLFFAEGFQVLMGYTGALAMHLPLGVAIVASTVAMFIWSLVWRPDQRSPGVGSQV